MLREALDIKAYYEIVSKDFVSDERLKQFAQDAEKYGPMLRNTKMQIVGTQTSDLMASSWNRALLFKLSKSAEFIAYSLANNPRRFGSPGTVDWGAIFRDKFREIVRNLRMVQMRAGETRAQAQVRILEAHMKDLSRKNVNEIRHAVRPSLRPCS